MKMVMIAYMALYILTVLGISLYQLIKTKQMNRLRMGLVIFCLSLILVSLVSYAQRYQPFQMVGFAVGFTFISSIFFYNATQTKTLRFAQIFTFSIIRLLIHIQLLFFLYLLR